MSEFDLDWGDEPRRRRRGRPQRTTGRRRQPRRQPEHPQRRASSRRRPTRRHDRRRGRVAPLLVGLVVVALLGGLALGSYRVLRDFLPPPDYAGSGSGSVVVEVARGETVRQIGDSLEEQGVVKSAAAFVSAARGHERGTSIQPGTYRLHARMRAELALEMLLDPKSRVRTQVTIPEGLRLAQILERVSKASDIPLRELRQVAENPAEIELPPYAGPKLEGYLYPDTYPIEPGMSAEEVLQAMVDRFKHEATDMNLVRRARRVNLTPKEAVTVASLVQAEGGRVADFPKVARVIYNRLAVDRNLELDSTVLYALGKYGIVASNRDLRSDSPYNTYRHEGLPPGPISSPGRDALEAALNPADGDWFWFVTTDPENRVTKFTDNVQEFQRFRRELQQNMNQNANQNANEDR